jgi:transposase
MMPIRDVARHLGVSWGTVKDIHKRRFVKKYGTPSLKGLRSIAIDEISIGAGHRYLTVVLNLESGAVVFVGDGKGSDALVPFWKRLGRRKKHIKSVAVDMSPAYTKAIRENLPKAALVYDHFHVIKLYKDVFCQRGNFRLNITDGANPLTDRFCDICEEGDDRGFYSMAGNKIWTARNDTGEME